MREILDCSAAARRRTSVIYRIRAGVPPAMGCDMTKIQWAQWMMAGAATLALAACAARSDDGMSGSTTGGGVPVYNSSVTATNGSWGVQEPGTNWGMPNPYNTPCTGACRFQ
jgi:hypothetical protein